MAKTKTYLLIALILGILLRLFLSTIAINKGDMLVHYDWAKTLYNIDLKNSYFYPIWTYSPPTQPPIMMLSFWYSRHIYENRYLLSELHNLTKIPPTNIILWFDTHGEMISLRLWAIIGDIVCSLLAYWFILKIKNNKKLALIGFILFFFNPLSIFETCFWGQNDIYGAAFIMLSFALLLSKRFKVISPAFFLAGILAKPTGLMLGPLFAIIYLLTFEYKNLKKISANFLVSITSLILCFGLLYISFAPFVDTSNFLNSISSVYERRISNSSKGASLASVSAINFYSLFFTIDKTPGTIKLLGISLDSIGLFIFIALNLLSTIFLFKYLKKSNKKSTLVLSAIFFVVQGSFLFMTGMLERYFFLAFLPAVILTVTQFKKVGINLIIQQLIWFINILYAFYLRDLDIVKIIFWEHGHLGMRIISLIALINFFIIIKKLYLINIEVQQVKVLPKEAHSKKLNFRL